MKREQSIGFIGTGNMGSCLVEGLVKKGYPPTSLWILDHHQEKTDLLRTATGVSVATTYEDLVHEADILVLAVKPSAIKSLLQAIAHDWSPQKLLVSVAAGITTTQMQHWLNEKKVSQNTFSLLRAMPNIPALYGYGTTGLFATEQVSEPTKKRAQKLFEAIGEIVWVQEESLMNVITALSGSGPGYFFYIMECMLQGAKHLGLSDEIAHKLTLHTALGSAMMALKSEQKLSSLRAKVTSPGGTTEQGIKALKDGKLEKLIQAALSAATEKGAWLSDQFD